ncbi:MAG: bifunctional metallophosphatase/5'-nucleotidase [Oscillospiraceae bacterium]|nr:bifunctional metallophosphatase/5'-nucleotidase [Oscillospiraceae bacterium]
MGVLTPKTLTTSTPAYFQNEAGDYIYGFMQDANGQAVCSAVQSAVDAARAEGAEFVYVLGHLGFGADSIPWTYADIIENTEGIDVFLDGHSHDTEQVVMKNKNGEEVTRIAVGTKLSCVGYSHISADGEIVETGIWSWTNSVPAPELLGIHNDISEKVDDAMRKLEEQLNAVVAATGVELTINDPVERDESGSPIRMIRRAETNLGDLCADACRDQSGAEIAFVNGGAIRVSIEKGDISYGDILNVHPFGSMLCVIEVSGQQILDALEWGAKELPDQFGGFLQVSGMSYELRVDVPSLCIEDENQMFAGIDGERRVMNVTVNGEPIDPEGTYTLAGYDYMLFEKGDGYAMFDGAPVLQDRVKQDSQVLIDYITDSLGGQIGEDYADPYGQGRISFPDTQEG